MVTHEIGREHESSMVDLDKFDVGAVLISSSQDGNEKLWLSVHRYNWYIVGLVQKRRRSSALAMELRLSCANPSICSQRRPC